MKKILFLLITAALSTAAFSQGAIQMKGPNNLLKDTVTNAATKNFTIRLKDGEGVSFVLTVNKISGTVGGTATLQGSNDGTNYQDLATAITLTDVATQGKALDFDKRKYGYYRYKVVGAGTMVVEVIATANSFTYHR
jgi:hypothetical protein